MKERKTLFIIDGTSLVYRAFHAIPHLSTSRGLPTNAIYGFAQTLRKIIKGCGPDYIGVAFDVKGPSFRHELFEEYKKERPPMPDSLSEQIPYIRKLVKAFGIHVLEKSGYEADDIIGSIARKFIDSPIRVVMISGDKDMLQLIGGNITSLDYVNDREYGEKEVKEKFGVEPEMIPDLLGLAGDPSDNIPGIPGIGPKTASKLINQFGGVEEIFKNIEKVSPDKLREKLKSHKDQAILSKRLATLHPELVFEPDLENLRYSGPRMEELEPLLKDLEFTKLLKDMMPERAGGVEITGEFKLCEDEEDLKSALKVLKEHKKVGILLQVTEEGVKGRLLGAALSYGHEKAFYMPADTGHGTLNEDIIAEILTGVLEDEDIKKFSDDSKALSILFGKRGIEVKGVEMDTSIASYLLNPSKADHTVETLCYEYLDAKALSLEEEGMAFEDAYRITCKKACNILELSRILEKMLKEEGLFDLFRSLEMPLAGVLADMEITGVMVDTGLLKRLSKEIERELTTLEKTIYDAAGMRFNINSPRQLSELLFKVLKLKPIKRTKTGYSTDEEVLTVLAARHEVPQHILGYRTLSKHKSTYVDALLELVDPATRRVHTSFNQTVTATGRLSSSKPNLQNIPARGDLGFRIREAFVAREGSSLISADYSQIELRLVAHMAGDPVLISAFNNDEDIHVRTAAEVFGVEPKAVTPEMRRRAKAINFGIIYGMGPYGLSIELGIKADEARVYIERYFERYSKVKDFIDRTIGQAKERGYTTTLFGRRRFIPEIRSSNEASVRLGERMAINTPIQGTAADLIKAAMIRIHERLKKDGLKSKMILQIHDELIFEVEKNESSRVAGMVKREMEEAFGIRLRVPIKVNMKFGSNWREVG